MAWWMFFLYTLALHPPRLRGTSLAQALGGLSMAAGGLGMHFSNLWADATENTVGGASLALTVAGLITALTAFWKNRDEGRAKLEQLRIERERQEREDARLAKELEIKERTLKLQEGMSDRFREYVNDLRKNYAMAKRKHPSMPDLPDMPPMPAAWYLTKPPSQTIPVTRPPEPKG